MNGLETLIHPAEGFAARESCTDTSKKEKTACVCARARVFGEGRALFPCVSERCDGRAIARWDKGEIGFSLPTVCVCVCVSAPAYRKPLAARQPSRERPGDVRAHAFMSEAPAAASP